MLYSIYVFFVNNDMHKPARGWESSPDMPAYVSERPCTEVCQSQTKYFSYDLHELKI